MLLAPMQRGMRSGSVVVMSAGLLSGALIVTAHSLMMAFALIADLWRSNMPIREVRIETPERVVEWRGGDIPTIFFQGTEKPIAEIELSPQSEGVCSICAIGDFHNASKCHNRRLLEATRSYILKHRLYVISPGVDPEMALRGSKSEEWQYRQVDGHSMTPAMELSDTVDFLRPIADEGLLVAMTDDNHGERWRRTAGGSFAEEVCKQLGVPEAYLGWQGHLNLKVGEQSYLVFVFHGSSAATTQSGKMRACLKLAEHNPRHHIFITGHLHDANGYQTTHIHPVDGYAAQRQQLFVMCGSYINYFGSYVEQKNYRPGKMGEQTIRLHADCRFATTEIGGYL